MAHEQAIGRRRLGRRLPCQDVDLSATIDTSGRLAAIPDLAMAKDLRDVLISLF
jgi:hypothetical protein